MFSVAQWLDASKSKMGIESDYRLAKLIEKNHSTISGWRSGKNAPDETAVNRICALSGEDPAPIIMLLQASRAQSDEARNVWLSIAKRLGAAPRQLQAGFASLSMMLVIIAISLLAAQAGLAAQNGKILSKISAAPVCIMLIIKGWLRRVIHWMRAPACAYA